MKTTFVSVQEFLQISPKYSWTIKHFINTRGFDVISGKAELFEEGPQVYYAHDLSNCWFRVYYQGVLLHQQEACTQKEILSAFQIAKDKFFLAEFSIIASEDIPFIATEKGKRFLSYCTSKKAIPDNHRGQKGRWKDRKAMKDGSLSNNCRFKGKPLPRFNCPYIEDDFPFEFLTSFPIPRDERSISDYIFLCKGMDVLIENDGSVGAISYNPRYFGYRIIRAA